MENTERQQANTRNENNDKIKQKQAVVASSLSPLGGAATGNATNKGEITVAKTGRQKGKGPITGSSPTKPS